MDASTENNYARDSLQELWGGEGVIRGHTFKSFMREYPQAQHVFNQTWWPKRYYNYELQSILLGRTIITTVTHSTLDQIIRAGGFDAYILSTSPAKLMSDLGCNLKKEMIYLLNKPDQAVASVRRGLRLFKGGQNADEYLEEVGQYKIPVETAKWINLPIYEALKLQYANELSEPYQPLDVYFTEKYKEELKRSVGKERTDVDDKGRKRTEVYSLEEYTVGMERDNPRDVYERLVNDEPNPTRSFLQNEKKHESETLAEIEFNLRKKLYGARYEMEELVRDHGNLANIWVNHNHPYVLKYQRPPPDLTSPTERKYSAYSKPSRTTWQG